MPNLFDRFFAFMETRTPGDCVFLGGALILFLCSLLWLAATAEARLFTRVPGVGGALTEGIVGTPRFGNPLLAVTTADQDLVALVYAGLLTRGTDGSLVPALAEEVTVSEDGLTYTARLREGITFHDGTALSADDVLFTIARAQDPAIKSPLRASWEGVAVERENEREVRFTLREPYTPFMENLTLGIMPKHIWEAVPAEEWLFSPYNSELIGAGPYAVKKIKKSENGTPLSYELSRNRAYALGAPNIKQILLRFYPTEDALVEAFVANDIESAGGLSSTALAALAETDVSVAEAPLPRTFALFFNQNELSLLRDDAVRKAFAQSAPRREVVAEALAGYGEVVSSPVPPGFGLEVPLVPEEAEEAVLQTGRTLLEEGGWKLNEEIGIREKKIDGEITPLAFSIATANAPVFAKTAELLKARYEALGARVEIKQFEQSDLIQTIIRPRRYDTLLFGTEVGRELDLFPFWHSSQRNDPGLNVALYANITTDTLLAGTRRTREAEERNALFQEFSEEIAADAPAAFLFVPAYIYAHTPDVENVGLRGIARGSERWSMVHQWYRETDLVWPFFAR